MAKKKALDLGMIQDRVTNDEPAEETQNGAYKEPPNYVARRMDTQQSIAKGKREKRLTYRIDPAVCKIRDDHDRNYSNLNEENCRDLIDGIKIHGQETPAIVRQLDSKDGYQYELVCGARRHWVTSYLKTDFIVEVRDLTEEEVFIISDEENRNRQDISDYERAMKYKRALGGLYESQIQMAERMGVTQDWLSRYLALSKLNDDIVGAYDDLGEIKVRHARELTPLMKDEAQANRILAEARAMHSARQKGPVVMARLKAAAKPKKKTAKPVTKQYAGQGTKKFVKAKAASPKKLVLEIDRQSGASLDDWLEAVKQAYRDFEKM